MKRILILTLIGFGAIIAKTQDISDTIKSNIQSKVIVKDSDTVKVVTKSKIVLENSDTATKTNVSKEITDIDVMAPDSTAVVPEPEPVIIEDEPDEVTVLSDEIIKRERGDSTHLKIGDVDIDIYDDGDGFDFSYKEGSDSTEPDDNFDFDWKKPKKKFKGHWSGLELGLNNFVDNSFSITRETGEEFMELNTGKSWNFNINFLQYSLPIFSDRFGLISGMGLEWSNYHFNGSNTIIKDNDMIVSETIDYPVIKSKLETTYLTAPLLMELQLFKGKRSKRLYVAGGVIGGLKLSSHTKVKYNDDGDRKKEKNRADFYISPFRYGFTGRIGYRALKLYFNYYMTDFFLEDKGPELKPIALGLVMSF
jgi:hypothetical protein